MTLLKHISYEDNNVKHIIQLDKNCLLCTKNHVLKMVRVRFLRWNTFINEELVN